MKFNFFSKTNNFVLFIINPFASFVYGLFLFFFKKSNALILALSLGLMFAYFPLMYDTSANFFSVQSGNIKNLYNWIPYILNKQFNLDYYYIIYLYTVIIFYCWFKSISFMGKESDKCSWAFVFCASFFLIIYRDVMDLHRIYLSFSLTFFYCYYFRKRFKFNLIIQFFLFFAFLILTISIHYYALIFFILFLIAQLPLNKISERWVYLFVFFILILGIYSQSLLNFILQTLPTSEWTQKIYFYISQQSKWGYIQKSVFSVIIKNLREILFLFLVIALSLQYRVIKKQNIVMNILILMSLLTLFCVMYRTLFERSYILISLFSIALFVYPNINKKQLYLKIALMILIVSRFFIVNIHDRGEFFLAKHDSIILNSDKKIKLELKPFYYPTFKLINITEQGYSDEFIKQNSRWK